MLANMLLDAGIAMAMGRMQKPAGKTLITVGQGLQAVGQEMEILGNELVRTAPPATHAKPSVRVPSMHWAP